MVDTEKVDFKAFLPQKKLSLYEGIASLTIVCSADGVNL